MSHMDQLGGEGSKQIVASPEKRFGRRSLIKYALAAGGVVLLGGASYEYYQNYVAVPKHCEACGMAIMPEMEQHLLIRDELTGQQVYACCQGCALKLADPVRGRKEYTIQTFCDYFGPERKITINVKDHGNSVTVDPVTARLLLGAKVVKSCANNRFAYNQEAVDGLLNKGFTQYTMTWQQHPTSRRDSGDGNSKGNACLSKWRNNLCCTFSNNAYDHCRSWRVDSRRLLASI